MSASGIRSVNGVGLIMVLLGWLEGAAANLRLWASPYAAPLRLAQIHRAIGFLQRAGWFGMRSKNGNAGGCTRGDGMAAEHEAKTVDVLLQCGRLGMRVGLGEIPKQQRKFIA